MSAEVVAGAQPEARLILTRHGPEPWPRARPISVALARAQVRHWILFLRSVAIARRSRPTSAKDVLRREVARFDRLHSSRLADPDLLRLRLVRLRVRGGPHRGPAPNSSVRAILRTST